MKKHKIVASLLLSTALLGSTVLTTASNVGAETIQLGTQKETEKAVTLEKKIDGTDIIWKVTIDTKNWGLGNTFLDGEGYYYFYFPKGTSIKSITEKGTNGDAKEYSSLNEYTSQHSGAKIKNSITDSQAFNDEWGWSVGRIGSEKTPQLDKLKNDGKFEQVLVSEARTDNGRVEWTFKIKPDSNVQNNLNEVPFVAVVKKLRKLGIGGESAALAADYSVEQELGVKPKSEEMIPTPKSIEKIIVRFKEGEDGGIIRLPIKYYIKNGFIDKEAILGETKLSDIAPRSPEIVIDTEYELQGWADEQGNLVTDSTPLRSGMVLHPIVVKAEKKIPDLSPKNESTPAPQPETPKAPSTPEKPMVDPKVSETEKPGTPEQPEVPAPSPSPESPKKEDMAPNKTKDEVYEPIVQTDKWVVYPVGTSKEEAEKKILDAVTVPKEAGETKKEIVGDVPLAAGQYGVNVKVIYDDKSYDITLVDVHVTSNQTDKQNEDMPQSPEQPPMSEMPKVEPKVEEMKPEVMPEIPEQPREPKGPEMPSPAPEQPKTPEVPDMSQPEVPKSETPKMEQPEVVPPTPESEKPHAPMKPETSSPEGPEMPRVPETPPTPAPEQPRVPEMSETPAPSPAPESPKKEEMVPNKTKDELYEPIISMVDWVAYPVGTSKEVAEKKILDAITVPQEAGPVTKEVVGEVPLVEGQYGVNVKVIYDDHSYDVVLVDVRVTKEKSHMDMPQPEAPKKETPKQEQPEMVIPEEKMPKADNPKQDTPKLEQPKVETPKEEAPKKEIPQTETPKIEVPKESEKEKSDIQKMAKPKQENQMAKESQKMDNPSEKMKPKSQGAKTTSPAVKQPMAEMSDGQKPQKSKETLPNTGEAGGSLTWLGAALATLSTFVYVFKNKKKEE
ncbi:LPXTG cell wall anchor domain-containing protein [Streptococcus suis]|uniref:Translation initiation factor 2 (IF-2; GTPase) n=1 Tax=Streptococcus suis TaxID=1307 RepID=A0A116JVM0_STRSU|nr:LPXTG cell wall anchor domain-containing protein [Streptococcus suis]NQH67531.1 LPXTG cell wall anchor domain-containing protein [Streptococcus suis]NQI05538.1 LPXTG cell wall anchor domain-containing protein [Streptococcus suis]CYU03269.1 Translation initiation factor 2 (IF-2%3B GTPase) [Streptococcus suis]CYU24772.1 Translation initiation factor 2 (IF-2%3B GTPase) [Streptococcus suis]HEP1840321.1 LPXTG cell wall anchor domain-containing protein [Streptococcus suis]